MRTTIIAGFALLLISSILMQVSGPANASDQVRSEGSIDPNQDWSGIPTIPEDSIPIAVMLDGPNPPFLVENENITRYLLAPQGSDIGSPNLTTTVAVLSIIGEPFSFSLMITPLPGMNGWASFELIGVGGNTSCNRTAALRISPVNDPPRIHSIMIGNQDHPIPEPAGNEYTIDLEGIEQVHDDSFLNFTINATDGDRPDEGDDLFFKFDVDRSDVWDERPTVDTYTGEVVLFITLDDWKTGNGKIVFKVRDQGFLEATLVISLKIDHDNEPPVITVPIMTRDTWMQYEMLEVAVEVEDRDSPGEILVDVNIDTSLDGVLPSLKEQLPHANLVRGANVGLDPALHLFWLDLVGQDIWKAGGNYVDTIQIMVMFKATDPQGASSSITLMFQLVDSNEPPIWTGNINAAPLTASMGQRVSFWVDPALDPDMDDLVYQWDFGDGSTAEGRVVEHIYSIKGWRTIICWASDGNETSEKLSIRIEVLETNYDERLEWYDQDNDGDGILNKADDFPNDRAASKDSDRDGHPDNWNIGHDQLDSTTGLTLDVFPQDRKEWVDSDGDGHGDNGDEFPTDREEWRDSDGDGVGDNADRFPHIPNDRLKWYVVGMASAILLVIAMLLFILRNTVNREDQYVDYHEE